MVLAGAKGSELAAEAKADAYMEALDDIPAWAVSGAVKRWFKGDCGNDERGQPYNYAWPPDPATLRKLAQRQVFMVKGRILELQDILNAKPYVDYSAELEKGHVAMKGIFIAMRDPQLMKSLTFELAAELGRSFRPKTGVTVTE
ncbi:MAG: hypothetical protein KGL39_20220 [Patescibacteria group bacterium]|nr:hypothetical protein [Patescibacteria group bacterium]